MDPNDDDNEIHNTDAQEDLRLSHSAKESSNNNQNDLESNGAAEEDDNENNRSRHVQFDDSPRIRAISIHKNTQHNEENPIDEANSDRREDGSSSKMS